MSVHESDSTASRKMSDGLALESFYLGLRNPARKKVAVLRERKKAIFLEEPAFLVSPTAALYHTKRRRGTRSVDGTEIPGIPR